MKIIYSGLNFYVTAYFTQNISTQYVIFLQYINFIINTLFTYLSKTEEVT